MFSKNIVSCCNFLKFLTPITSIYWRALRVCFGKMIALEMKLQVSNVRVEMYI